MKHRTALFNVCVLVYLYRVVLSLLVGTGLVILLLGVDIPDVTAICSAAKDILNNLKGCAH